MCYKTKCRKECFESICFCKLPILSLDHIEINCKCGRMSLYHILCISDTTRCSDCNAFISKEMMLQIKDAKQKITINYKKEKLRENKQRIVRKQIQKIITQKVLPSFIK